MASEIASGVIIIFQVSILPGHLEQNGNRDQEGSGWPVATRVKHKPIEDEFADPVNQTLFATQHPNVRS
jgi:hypothetical protein